MWTTWTRELRSVMKLGLFGLLPTDGIAQQERGVSSIFKRFKVDTYENMNQSRFHEHLWFVVCLHTTFNIPGMLMELRWHKSSTVDRTALVHTFSSIRRNEYYTNLKICWRSRILSLTFLRMKEYRYLIRWPYTSTGIWRHFQSSPHTPGLA